jgi:hypothetical protein
VSDEKELDTKHGIPMTEEEIKEAEQVWKDMEDCFNNLEVLDEEDD